MNDDINKKDIRNLKKMDKHVVTEKQQSQIKEKSFDELWKEGKANEKKAKKEIKKQQRQEKINILTKKRDELLHERKQALEIEKTKTDIKRLKSESSAFGKFKKLHQKIISKQGKQAYRKTQPQIRQRTTNVSSITEAGRYKLLIIDGKPMSFDTQTGKLKNAKASNQPKKKKEGWL